MQLKQKKRVLGLLCIALCAALFSAPACAQEAPAALAEAVEGASFLAERAGWGMQLDKILRALRSGEYVQDGDRASDFEVDSEGRVYCSTLDLRTLSEGSGEYLALFDEEPALRVLPMRSYCYVLTAQAIYRLNADLSLAERAPLPAALRAMPGYERYLRGCEISPSGSLLCFEAAALDGIYTCALRADAQPVRLLPGTTFADEASGTLEGYRAPRFIGEDRLMVYITNREERLGWEIYDLAGRRLYNSFLFNEREISQASYFGEFEDIDRRETLDAQGLFMSNPSSGRVGNCYFDFASLRMRMLGDFGLREENRMVFCALAGPTCLFANAVYDYDAERTDIRFFALDLADETNAPQPLPFILHGAEIINAALAPDGRILFCAEDQASGQVYAGAFALAGEPMDAEEDVEMKSIADAEILQYAAYQAEQPPIYEKLIEALQPLGIDAALISVKQRGESRSLVACDASDPHARADSDGQAHKTVPTLAIFVRTSENYDALGIDAHDSNWDSDYPQTDAIREIWRGLLSMRGLLGMREVLTDAVYDPDMLVFIYSLPEWVTTALVYERVDAVKQAVRALHAAQPQAIYRCSEPGYRVVYASAGNYAWAEANGAFEAIEEEILRVLQAAAPQEMREEVENYLSISFFHPEMEGYSAYGFSRED